MEFNENLTDMGYATHRANQEFIETQLKADAPEWVWLEMIAEDGIRAQHTLELIRKDCEHGEFEHDRCAYCGELEVNDL